MIGGLTNHYDLIASSDKSAANTVLFLHGLGSSSKDWSEQLPALKPHYHILFMDLRGHGLSNKPAGPYSIREMAADVAGLIAQLNLKDLHVVGLSIGAQVDLQLALDYPAGVATVTAVNSPADMVPRRLRDKFAVLQRKLLVRLLGMRGVGMAIAGRLLPGTEFTDRRQLFAES
ncbi:MAG: alpha/beta fold hydrolase [Granulosicoccus sp.]